MFEGEHMDRSAAVWERGLGKEAPGVRLRRLDTMTSGNREPWVVPKHSSDTARACVRERSPEAARGVVGG